MFFCIMMFFCIAMLFARGMEVSERNVNFGTRLGAYPHQYPDNYLKYFPFMISEMVHWREKNKKIRIYRGIRKPKSDGMSLAVVRVKMF